MNARPREFLTELGAAFGWRATSAIAMTWIYFDESGEHGSDGQLQRLTLGCGIASFEAWQQLTIEWNAVLSEAGVPWFHMADFEARKRPFDSWGEEKRRGVLNRLLDIASKHVHAFCGYNGNPSKIIGKQGFRSVYSQNLMKALKETVLKLDEFNVGGINLFFAKHKDISAELIGRHIDFFNYWAKGHIRSAGFGSPVDVAALQVADLVASRQRMTTEQSSGDTVECRLLRPMAPWQ